MSRKAKDSRPSAFRFAPGFLFTERLVSVIAGLISVSIRPAMMLTSPVWGRTYAVHIRATALGFGQGVCEGATGVYSSVNEDSEQANNAEISQVRKS